MSKGPDVLRDGISFALGAAIIAAPMASQEVLIDSSQRSDKQTINHPQFEAVVRLPFLEMQAVGLDPNMLIPQNRKRWQEPPRKISSRAEIPSPRFSHTKARRS